MWVLSYLVVVEWNWFSLSVWRVIYIERFRILLNSSTFRNLSERTEKGFGLKYNYKAIHLDAVYERQNLETT